MPCLNRIGWLVSIPVMFVLFVVAAAVVCQRFCPKCPKDEDKVAAVPPVVWPVTSVVIDNSMSDKTQATATVTHRGWLPFGKTLELTLNAATADAALASLELEPADSLQAEADPASQTAISDLQQAFRIEPDATSTRLSQRLTELIGKEISVTTASKKPTTGVLDSFDATSLTFKAPPSVTPPTVQRTAIDKITFASDAVSGGTRKVRIRAVRPLGGPGSVRYQLATTPWTTQAWVTLPPGPTPGNEAKIYAGFTNSTAYRWDHVDLLLKKNDAAAYQLAVTQLSPKDILTQHVNPMPVAGVAWHVQVAPEHRTDLIFDASTQMSGAAAYTWTSLTYPVEMHDVLDGAALSVVDANGIPLLQLTSIPGPSDRSLNPGDTAHERRLIPLRPVQTTAVTYHGPSDIFARVLSIDLEQRTFTASIGRAAEFTATFGPVGQFTIKVFPVEESGVKLPAPPTLTKAAPKMQLIGTTGRQSTLPILALTRKQAQDLANRGVLPSGASQLLGSAVTP